MKSKLDDGIGTDAKVGGLYQDDLVSTCKPSLNNLSAVSQIVREYVKDVLNVRAEFNLGQGGAGLPLAKIETAASRMGKVFLGRDNRFDAQPWNTPNRIGMTLAMLFPEERNTTGTRALQRSCGWQGKPSWRRNLWKMAAMRKMRKSD
jgi:hypothetical protein